MVLDCRYIMCSINHVKCKDLCIDRFSRLYSLRMSHQTAHKKKQCMIACIFCIGDIAKILLYIAICLLYIQNPTLLTAANLILIVPCVTMVGWTLSLSPICNIMAMGIIYTFFHPGTLNAHVHIQLCGSTQLDPTPRLDQYSTIIITLLGQDSTQSI